MQAPSSSTVQIRQGLVFDLEQRRLGVMAVVPARGSDGLMAKVAVMPTGAIQAHRNDYNVTLWVHGGDLVPLGTSFYLVVHVVADGGPPAGPGGSRAAVVLDKTPQTPAGLSLAPGALAVPIEGHLELHGRELEVERIERRKASGESKVTAHLALWSNDFEKEREEKQGRVARVTISAGELLVIGSKKHKVLAVVEPQPALHLLGYIEIEAKAAD